MLSATITGSQATVGSIPIFSGLLVVVSIFSLALGTIWLLRRIGGRLTAEVVGQARSSKNSLKINAEGLGGYFLALVICGFAGLYFVVVVLAR